MPILSIVKKSAYVVPSPFVFVCMLLLMESFGFFGPIALEIGFSLVFLFLGSELVVDEMRADTEIFESTSSANAISNDNQITIPVSMPKENKFLTFYRKMERAWTIGYSMSCILLTSSYLYMLSNRLPWGSNRDYSSMLTYILFFLSALGNSCSLLLPAAFQDWVEAGSGMFILLGTGLWALMSQTGIFFTPDTSNITSSAVQLLVYVMFILYGAKALRRPLQNSQDVGSATYLLSAAQLILFMSSCLPGIIWYYYPRSLLHEIFTITSTTTESVAARTCWIIGLIGTNMAIIMNLRQKKLIPREPMAHAVRGALIVALPLCIPFLVNRFAPLGLPYIIHYTVLIAGGIITPFIAFIMPMILRSMLTTSRGIKYAYRLLVLFIVVFFAITTKIVFSEASISLSMFTTVELPNNQSMALI